MLLKLCNPAMQSMPVVSKTALPLTCCTIAFHQPQSNSSTGQPDRLLLSQLLFIFSQDTIPPLYFYFVVVVKCVVRQIYLYHYTTTWFQVGLPVISSYCLCPSKNYWLLFLITSFACALPASRQPVALWCLNGSACHSICSSQPHVEKNNLQM